MSTNDIQRTYIFRYIASPIELFHVVLSNCPPENRSPVFQV